MTSAAKTNPSRERRMGSRLEVLLVFLRLGVSCFGAWYWTLGSISVATVTTPKVEAFYWAAITFSQTLGTALGDWMADGTGLGYAGGALVFAAGLAVLAAAYSRHTFLESFCSGPPLFSPDRLERPLVISSTSRSAMADWR